MGTPSFPVLAPRWYISRRLDTAAPNTDRPPLIIAMAALAPVPLIPARRPRSPEIIDVDALEDDVLFAGFRRSVRPRLEIPIVGVPSEAGPSSRPQTVIVIDSDDETERASALRRSPGLYNI